MEDIFILEDDEVYQRILEIQIPEGLTHVLAGDGKEFEDYLANDGRARLYFLDDRVPDASGNVGFHFLKHCAHLLELRPDSKVFYHGSAPDREERAYCHEHAIPIVARRDIGDIIKNELGEK